MIVNNAMTDMKQVIRYLVDATDEEMIGLRLMMLTETVVKAIVAIYVIGQMTGEQLRRVLPVVQMYLTRLGELFVYKIPQSSDARLIKN